MKATSITGRRPRSRGSRTTRTKRLLLVGAAAAAAGAAVARLARSTRPGPSTWFAVTVLADPADLTGQDRPDVLARLSECHEVRITRAPGGRGSEIAVRAADGRTRQEVRELKQLLETGEVLRVEGQPEGHRTALGRTTLPAFRRLTRKGLR
jgi:hypothetical protein